MTIKLPLTSTRMSGLFSPQKHNLYLYGNTLAEDLLLPCSYIFDKMDKLSVLQLGCGDLRHSLQTIAETRRKQIKSQLEFTLVDREIEVIARNALMLYAIKYEHVGEFLLASFWYSLEWTEEIKDYWDQVITNALQKAEQDFPFTCNDFEAIKKIWKAWLGSKLTSQEMQQQRITFLSKEPEFMLNKKTVKEAFANRLQIQVVREHHQNEVPEKAVDQLSEIIKLATLTKGEFFNPSLCKVLLTELIYALDPGTFIYEGLDIDLELGVHESIYKALNSWINAFRESQVQFNLVFGDAVDFIVSKSACDEKFDVIETSNLADHCGLVNLVVHSSSLLKKPRSVLRCSSLNMFENQPTRKEYLDFALSAPKESFPSIFGVELIEHSDSWPHCYDPFSPELARIVSFTDSKPEGRAHERFIFEKTILPSDPIDISLSPYLLETFQKMAKELFTTPKDKIENAGDSNCGASLFSRILAIAFAEKRLCYGKQTDSFPDPIKMFDLFSQLPNYGVQHTVAEMRTFLSLYGFDGPGLYKNPLYISHIFNFPKPTAAFRLHFEVHQNFFFSNFESMNFEILNNNRIKIDFYLPGYPEKEWDDIQVRLVVRTAGSFIADCLNLSELAPRKCQSGDLAYCLPFKNYRLDSESYLRVETIKEELKTFTVKLLFSEKQPDAKIELVEVKGIFHGIKVDSVFQPIQLTCKTSCDSCKIHRKAGFVLLTLKKNLSFYKPPKLSLESLDVPKFSPFDVVELRKMFITNEIISPLEFSDPKNKCKKSKPVNRFLFQIQSLIESMFLSFHKSKYFLFLGFHQNYLGLLRVDSFAKYPRTDDSHYRTPMIQASLFLGSNMQVDRKIFEFVCVDPFRRITDFFIADQDMQIFYSLFEIYRQASAITDDPDPDFKPCVMFPIYHVYNSKKEKTAYVIEREQLRKQTRAFVDATDDIPDGFSNVPTFYM